jgi:hypothetical protein
MAVSVYSYTIYHSPNAYLGTVLLRRALAELPRWNWCGGRFTCRANAA